VSVRSPILGVTVSWGDVGPPAEPYGIADHGVTSERSLGDGASLFDCARKWLQWSHLRGGCCAPFVVQEPNSGRGRAAG
jgi:hypothetical protein